MTRLKLAVKNLSKSFGDLLVLNDLSLNVRKSEFVSVVGPSGCGKSTLFNIIAGIEKNNSGQIELDGKIFKDRLGKCGYMLQKPLLLPWKTVEENVRMGLTVKKVVPEIAKKHSSALLSRFGLADFADVYPDKLSGGMAQRVALLRTILFNKNFLLMDEPFGALDTLTRLSMQLWLMEVWSQFQSSVIFITHDLREAILLSDRIYILSHRPGTVIEEIKVRLPRPRKRDIMTAQKFVKLERKLDNLLLKEQSVLNCE